MLLNGPREALEFVGELHARLRSEVEGLSPAQQVFRSDPDRWTIAEIVEHLSIVQEGMGKVTSKLLGEAEAAGAYSKPDHQIAPFSADFVPTRADQRFTAPERVRPRGTASIADSLIKMEQDYARLQSLGPRVEAVDLAPFTFPHPAFGDLTGYQWLALLGSHEQRHLEQIAEIKSSPGYPL